MFMFRREKRTLKHSAASSTLGSNLPLAAPPLPVIPDPMFPAPQGLPVSASPAPSGCACLPLPLVIYLHAPKPHWRGRLVRRRPRRASGRRASHALPGLYSGCPLPLP